MFPEHTLDNAGVASGQVMQPDPITIETFAAVVVDWQKRFGRHHLPWQQSHDAYRIWLSEIMLQQTQVSTVIGYYERFLERFPTLTDLAQARQEDVMPYWAGLGYYARARNLHRCAQAVQANHEGRFPQNPEQIAELPGIGRSTAGAIAAFAWQVRTPIMDGNVKRVFTRFFGIEGYPGNSTVDKALWALAHDALDAAPAALDMRAYTQGLMDLGSSVCTRRKPDCSRCPLQNGCHANAHHLQDALPTPKPRKTVPTRQCHMLIVVEQTRVLLVQRENEGIWGGLLSLPQFDTEDDLRAFCRQQGLTLDPSNRMGGLTHVFSHFKLEITPWRIESNINRLNEPLRGQHWFELSTADTLAVPAPVKKILTGLHPTQSALFADQRTGP